MKLKCEDCGWEGQDKACVRKYEGVPCSDGDVELVCLCPDCGSFNLDTIEGEEVSIPV